MTKIRLGILREGKVPHDRRVPFTPAQCKELLRQYPDLEIIIQPCPYRCFPDDEFAKAGIPVSENLSGCDILMGIKEVPVLDLLPEKTYLFFSHTIKKQPHNQKLLQAVIQKKINLIDYERLTYPDGFRVLGFGRFAGIVGVYNALIGYGRRHRLFNLKPAHLCKDRNEMNEELIKIKLPPLKIVITGEGRVAGGAKESLHVAGIRQVEPEEFLAATFSEPVYCRLGVTKYNRRKDGAPPVEADFYKNPGAYESAFLPYTKVSNIFVSCHFWDPKAPRLFSVADMKKPDFKIKVIADVSCDINGSVPSTIRSTEIDNPFFGFNPLTGKESPPASLWRPKEEAAFNENCVTVMAVDNLPCELPRDSSADFGLQLIKDVMPHLLSAVPDPMIERATIAYHGTLTSTYSYLSDYV